MSPPLTASSTVTAEGRPSLLVLHQSKKDVTPGEYSAERLTLLSSKESYEQVSTEFVLFDLLDLTISEGSQGHRKKS